MSAKATIRIEFTGFWLAGTGTARGRDVDDVVYRDRYGCPAMPMTQVKGQLRETAEWLAEGNKAGWTSERVNTLFGTRSRRNATTAGEETKAGQGEQAAGAPANAASDVQADGMEAHTTPGVLAFRGEAHLDESVRRYFNHEDNHAKRAELFRRIDGTAIDRFGAAKDKTLRSVEAAVPMLITGTIECKEPPGCDWVAVLEAAAAATLAFGKLKADGYGRAIAEVKAETAL